MSASDRTHKVIIEKPGTAVDSLNQTLPDQPWEPVFAFGAMWASILGITGKSIIAQGLSITRYSIGIKYRPTNEITSGMRVNHDGVFYNIQTISHDHVNKEWTWLICETGGNDG